MAFLGQEEQVREYQDRFKYLYTILFLAVTILLGRLVDLQILRGDKMRQASEDNRIKKVKIAAPRGMIFDRNRRLLVDNRPSFDIEIIPQYLYESKQTDAVMSRLSKILHLSEPEIHEILRKNKSQGAFLPVKIKTDLSRDEVAEIESWKLDMPGVQITEEIQRTNIFGEVASHLLGYIGEITQTEYTALSKDPKNTYKKGDSSGKFGLEQKLEPVLRGQDGEKLLEVDALGRTKLNKNKGRVLDELPEKPAVPGKNLLLTIDQDLQLAAAKAFGDKAGSLVAIDPRNGEILAMVSRPGFDPTVFSRGISNKLWQSLLANEKKPLIDRTIQGQYSPGSTFKVLTAIAGLEEGVIDEHTKFHCPGYIWVGNRKMHCHEKKGHGEVSVVTAITRSCDVFFYRVAQRLKSVDDIAKWARHLGLGRKTGINLAREAKGLIPTEDWKLKTYGEAWNGGETLSVAIGQSYVLTTTLQLANLYASIGNGGTLYQPFMVKEVESFEGQILEQFQPKVVDSAKIGERTRELIMQGLWGVINSPIGTARSQVLPGMDFVGKTGTVQVMAVSADRIYHKCDTYKYKERHHGVFAGFAPATNPVIAVAVIAEHACSGSRGAAPIGRAVVKTYLEKYFPDLYGEKAVAARLKGKPAPTHLTFPTEPVHAVPEDDENEAILPNTDVRPDRRATETDTEVVPPEPPSLTPTGDE